MTCHSLLCVKLCLLMANKMDDDDEFMYCAGEILIVFLSLVY